MPVNALNLRSALAEFLNEADDETRSNIRETILVKSGLYCGRRFALNGHTLTWFAEENQVKLTAPDGRLLVTCAANDFLVSEPARRAA